jgi:hypothetical protein
MRGKQHSNSQADREAWLPFGEHTERGVARELMAYEQGHQQRIEKFGCTQRGHKRREHEMKVHVLRAG